MDREKVIALVVAAVLLVLTGTVRHRGRTNVGRSLVREELVGPLRVVLDLELFRECRADLSRDFVDPQRESTEGRIVAAAAPGMSVKATSACDLPDDIRDHLEVVIPSRDDIDLNRNLLLLDGRIADLEDRAEIDDGRFDDQGLDRLVGREPENRRVALVADVGEQAEEVLGVELLPLERCGLVVSTDGVATSCSARRDPLVVTSTRPTMSSASTSLRPRFTTR